MLREARGSVKLRSITEIRVLVPPIYTSRIGGLYSSHESPSGIVIMSRLMKRRRSLLRRVILLTALTMVSAAWFANNRPQAQQVPNQHRPRRVGADHGRVLECIDHIL